MLYSINVWYANGSQSFITYSSEEKALAALEKSGFEKFAPDGRWKNWRRMTERGFEYADFYKVAAKDYEEF